MLLMWNESYAVKTREALGKVKNMVQSVLGLNAKNEGKVVHVCDHLSGPGVTDSRFSIGAGKGLNADDGIPVAVAVPIDEHGRPVAVPEQPDQADISHQLLRLQRTVQMYQWAQKVKTETQKKIGGGTATTKTYRYVKEWSGGRNDSSRFEKQRDHENPELHVRDENFNTPWLQIGEFSVPPSLVSQLSSQSLTRSLIARNLRVITDSNSGAMLRRQGDSDWFQTVEAHNAMVARAPVVGDVRIRFDAVCKPVLASVIGLQRNNELVAPPGHSSLIFARGNQDASSMLESQATFGSALTWCLRGLGCLLAYAGFKMVMDPAVTVANILPILGSGVEVGTSLVAIQSTVLLGGLSISAGWLRARVSHWILQKGIDVSFLVLLGMGAVRLYTINRNAAAAVASAAASTTKSIAGTVRGAFNG